MKKFFQWIFPCRNSSCGNNYFGCKCGDFGGKTKKAEQQADVARQQEEQAQRNAAALQAEAARKAQQEIIASGNTVRQNLTEAAQSTGEETSRLSRYQGKAGTPGETLMTQTGPIAQAVARRVQERVETPGLDYERNLPAYVESVSNPVWRALKARGIVPPPGTEGGLATQQAIVEIEPALAQLRTGQISSDISRGQQYTDEARQTQSYYEDLEQGLANLLAERTSSASQRGAELKYQADTGAAPYTTSAAAAEAQGILGPAQSISAYKQSQAQQAAESQAKTGKTIGTLLGTALMAIPGMQPVGMAILAAQGIQGTMGSGSSQQSAIPATTSTYSGPITAPSLRIPEETAYSRALAARMKG